MARLPTQIDTGAPRGARPSGRVAQADFSGLQDVAAGLEQVGRAFEIRDDRAAQKVLEASRGDLETRFGEMAAGYDGHEPGFANKALAAFDNHFSAVTEDRSYSSGLRAALRRRVDAYKSEFGNRALGVESQARAGVVAEQRKVAEQARLGQELIGFNAVFAEKYQARMDAFDGSDPEFAAGVLADFDEAAKARLEASPEDLRPNLQATLTARRVQVHAAALETQDKGHGAFVAKHAERTLAALANTVLSNPAAHDAVQGDLETAAAGVPGAIRAEFLREAKGALATARLEGLILKDDPEAARAELNSGRFDEVLSPDRKSALLARAEAAAERGPRTAAEWARAFEADELVEAEVDARARGETTGLSLQSIADVFSPRELAAAQRKLQLADEVFAATGDIKSADNATLRARAAAPPPDAGEPGFPEKQRAWELSRKAAAEELAAREKDPAAWALASKRAGDWGAQTQGRLKGYLEAEGPEARAKAAGGYAGWTLGLQARAGVPLTSMRVFSKDQASALARAYAKSTPEARDEALAALAATWDALPSNVRLADGRTINAKAMAARELKAAGLAPADVSAMTDLADNPGMLGLYAAATANPQATANLPGRGAEADLRSAVDARLSSFFATANALPGSAEQNDGRAARARIIARHLVTAKGLSPREAAEQATADLVDGYKFVDGWRMPKARALAKDNDGDWRYVRARNGAAKALADLLANDGALLTPAPAGPGVTEADRRRISADVVENKGRWVTNEDDSGLTLMVPTSRGWTPVADRHGRAVRLTWDQLEARSEARGPTWLAPPPAAAAPVRASPAKARAAFAAAIEYRESAGDPRAVSPKGAAGLRQLMPGTAKWQASMDGLKVFAGKSDDEVRAMLLADPALNRRISDSHIDFLARRYDGNVGLIAAAYNAGPGAVDGWLRRFGDPRRGRVSLDDWVADIPFEETRKYVRAVLPLALKNLQRG